MTETQYNFNLPLENVLECLFFVASEPLTIKQLKEICGAEKADIEAAIAKLSEDYSKRGFCLKQIAGGWQFMTEAEYAPVIEKLYRPKFHKLSMQAMETLAIIAYKQPVTRAEISEIRQVDADGVVATLLDKKLIKEVGRLDVPGRPILYGTSEQFLSFFGINTLKDLPPLPADDEKVAAADIDLDLPLIDPSQPERADSSSED